MKEKRSNDSQQLVSEQRHIIKLSSIKAVAQMLEFWISWLHWFSPLHHKENLQRLVYFTWVGFKFTTQDPIRVKLNKEFAAEAFQSEGELKNNNR